MRRVRVIFLLLGSISGCGLSSKGESSEHNTNSEHDTNYELP